MPEEFDRFRVGGRFTESFRDIGVDKLPGNSFVVWAKTTKAEMKIIDEKEKEKLREKKKQAEVRTEQTKKVSAVLSEAVFDSDMDKDLKKATIKSLVDITSAVVQHVMNHDSSPEQILNAIIEEIKSNEGQIKKEGKVNVELIENVVSGFVIAVDEEQTESSMDVEGVCKSEHEKNLEPQSTSTFDSQEDELEVEEFFREQRISKEINADYIDQNGLLHRAVWEGKLEVVEFLICKGASVNAEYANCGKPIHIATAAGHRNIVGFLLNRISVNEGDKSGYTPLHYAAYNGQLEMVQFLIASEANIHAQAQDGVTPLHFAAFYGHLDTAKFLVEKGANINVEDNYKNTPMGLAIAQNRQDIIEFFNVLLPTPNSSLEEVSTCSGNTRLQK